MRLDTHLKATGLTDQAFAEMIGCERSFVTRLRHGETCARFVLMERIERATGGRVTAADIYEARKARLAALAPKSKSRKRTSKAQAAE